jgi:D-aminopeptidase
VKRPARAPLDHRNLQRLAARSMLGLDRTGAAASNGSGDYAIAFSTATDLRIRPATKAGERTTPRELKILANEAISPLFLAAIEATEEAVYNSLFRATTLTGQGRTVEALPPLRLVGDGEEQHWISRAHRAGQKTAPAPTN